MALNKNHSEGGGVIVNNTERLEKQTSKNRTSITRT
ncbi:WBP2 isoform 12 [Pan troglodytes]|uniref:WW domain binding protein 2 n=2 Tax=Homininae TaxID=207598 RepID=K7EJ75_HUMAN|nr:WBP2 isoform 12 [Pan troglodytes]